MAEGAVVKVLLQTVTKLALEEAMFLGEVKGKIDRLQTELEWMHLSIIEADDALVSDEKQKLWVKQARGIIFDSEDVIDAFILEIVNQKRFRRDPKALTASMKSSIRAVTQLPSMHEYGNRIKEINTRVTDLKANKEKYWFESAKSTGGGAGSSNQLSSLPLHQKIEERRAAIAAEEIGDAIHINEDSVRQLESLLTGDEGKTTWFKKIYNFMPHSYFSDMPQEPCSDEKGLRVISILGMGGVGKTTLSKKIYNLMHHFDCRAFFYISKSYRPQEPLKSIMKCFPSISSKEQLSNEKLHAHLRGKKYLVVLDDVWDTKAWDGLKSSFPDEKNGSRVLLTTRHEDVAFYASRSDTNIHKMSIINEMESWKLFLKTLSPLKDTITSEQIVLSKQTEVLGRKMVGQCYGLPLAIVVLGSLLLTRPISVSWWRDVNTRASWHLSRGEKSYECSGILALSYDYLPYYLKPCFLYMSLFPEDTEIRATKLFQCWIAEGLIQKQGEQNLEDIAENFLEELIRRSLIQVSKLRCDGIRVKTCRIHNLLRDISVTESEGGQFSKIYGSIDKFYLGQDSSRRAAVYCGDDDSNEKYLNEFTYKKIRSLICQRARFTKGTYLGSLFGVFKSLRVLEIYSCTKGRVSLPKEVGELIHLRYLSLEKTKLEKIDTSFLGKLVNLQTLNLKECDSELKLDDQIWSLRQLRNLYLDILKPRANKSRIFGLTATVDKLDIGNLTNLQLLVIQAGDWINSGGLRRLSSLRKLRIEECLDSHCFDISNALVNLTELRSLALIYKSSSTPLPGEDVPVTSIQFSNNNFLHSLHYKGEIRGWSTTSRSISFPPTLCKLKMESSRIEEDPMPILEKLPCLKFLHLGIDSYEGKEMVCSEGGFGCLENLEIFWLGKLEEWTIHDGALTSLVDLEIHGCGNLEMIPHGLQHLKKLQILGIVNMPLQFQNRSKKAVGKDWDYIKHIPSVNINGW